MSVDAVAVGGREDHRSVSACLVRAGGARTQGVIATRPQSRATEMNVGRRGRCGGQGDHRSVSACPVRAGGARTQGVIAARPQSRATEMNVGRRSRCGGQEHRDHCEAQAGVTWTCDRHPGMVRFPLIRD